MFYMIIGFSILRLIFKINSHKAGMILLVKVVKYLPQKITPLPSLTVIVKGANSKRVFGKAEISAADGRFIACLCIL